MVRLEEIIRMNPWWAEGIKFADSDRDLSILSSKAFKVQRSVPKFTPGNIYIIKGPRRVGKTVFLKSLILDLLARGAEKLSIFYYSLDSVKNPEELRNMLNNFFDKPVAGTRYVMLDEVQGVKGWEGVMQALVNEGMFKNAVVIVTGSLAHVLRQELMPGRGTEGNTYLMHPLTFNDFCTNLLSIFALHRNGKANTIKDAILNLATISANILKSDYFKIMAILGDEKLLENAEGILRALESRISLEEDIESIYSKLDSIAPYALILKKLFEVYMRTGGYPMSISSYFAVGKLSGYSINPSIYEELYNYAKSDAATIVGSGRAGNPAFAEIVLKNSLENIGSSISYRKLSNQASMNTKTFIEYLQRLKESYVFITLQGLDNDITPMRLKKVYFSDPFVHYSVGSIVTGEEPNKYTETVINSYNVGAVVEEIIASHISHIKESEPMLRYETYLNFLKSKKEIDFIYKRNNKTYIGIEVKYQNTVSAKNDLYKIGSINEYLIISKDTFEKGKDYAIIPAYLLLAALQKSDKNL